MRNIILGLLVVFMLAGCSERRANILVEIYDADKKELVFIEVLEADELFKTTSFSHPIKMSGVSLTVVRDVGTSRKEAREIRERAGWDLSPYTKGKHE